MGGRRGTVVRGRPGGDGVILEAPAPWSQVFDLESCWTARPREESITFGRSQAPRHIPPEDLFDVLDDEDRDE